MSANLVQVSIYSVSPGEHLTLNIILMYYQKVYVFSNKLRLIMQMFVRFQEKDLLASWFLLKTHARLQCLWKNFNLEVHWRHQHLNFFFFFKLEEVLTPTIKWDWWTYFPYIVLFHWGDVQNVRRLLSVWKIRQSFYGSTNIRISWSEVVIWELGRCLLQKHEQVLKTGLINLAESRLRFTVLQFFLLLS